MSNLALNFNDKAEVVLKEIKNAINKNESIISINANFYFTKGKPGRISGHILRDHFLENEVRNWLESRVSFNTVIARYKKYDPELMSIEWPKHYATRFVNISGKAAEGENIFMFFPEVLGLSSGKIEDYFGFEFIDIWASVFDEIIFPCMRKVFDEESQLKLFTTLRPVLEKTIYLAAIFHEVGHRCGCWKVSPAKDIGVNINKFHTDTLGELGTDTLSINFLEEFPEIHYFIFLQRLFWFGRFGFKANQISGKLNEDNDTWIGAYLWNKYIEHGVLTQTADHRWHVNTDQLMQTFSAVLDDTDQLGEKVVVNQDQDKIIHQWMKNQVNYNENQFSYPDKMRSLFLKCIHIIEKPMGKY